MRVLGFVWLALLVLELTRGLSSLASFFIGRDAERDDAEIAGRDAIEGLRSEIAGLRSEVRAMHAERSS
jgi:voltage-gated potassium channel